MPSSPTATWLPDRRHPRRAGRELGGGRTNPLRVEVQAAQGRDVPGQARRDGSARADRRADVVFSYYRLNKSPKKIPGYFDHVDKVEATGQAHGTCSRLKNYNAEWDYRFGWGYYSRHLCPRRVVDAGAGQLEERQRHRALPAHRLRAGQFLPPSARTRSTGTSETIGGTELQAALRRQDHLPHDQGRGRRWITALRTGKVDMLEAIRWSARGEPEEERPAAAVEPLAQHTAAQFMAMRMDVRSRSTTSACAVR